MFGGLFDFNKDGKMSAFERASELGFLHHMMESEKAEGTATDTGFGFSDDDDDEADKSLELMASGLDEVELSLMDEDDRRIALEDAGLDPDDFGFLDDL
ncbi:MAG: hypothetical protein E7467_00290 [Ruminococcaceae bacterium]|nr:hypothetical protein [Oscillospiraceae bacterium]